ncbi:hypothetical protein ABT127_30200 [Streptomyces sp. NPDC001904]|uniref:hypothetical protein n=1 Tax=Streptomyces sp. NPDC001904 TaxID=3154531 RepID=UPI003319C4D0
MKTRTAIIAVALLAATLAGCTRTEANKRTDCRNALTDGAATADRPDACKDVSEDDYQTLLADWREENKDIIDENGGIDPNKLFDNG